MARPALTMHVRTDAESAAAVAKKQARLDEIAGEARKLHKRIEGDTLALGKLLTEVLDRNLVKARSDYDFERWGKVPDGQIAAVVDWYRAEIGPISQSRVTHLVNAARTNEVIFTRVRVGLRPTNEAQLRPLTSVRKTDGRKVAPAWERALELAAEAPSGHSKVPDGQPTAAQVTKAAREVCPEAFKAEPKRHLKIVPGKTARKRKDKAGARQALAELLEQFDRAVLEAAWTELQ